jgi:uncharacterized RDD family membrane protein YckC
LKLFEKKGEGRPPVDVLGLVAVLAVFSALSFLFAALSQLSGPVVETGVSPQTVAGLQWSAVGIVLSILAGFVYLQRPIGWYGTLVAAMVCVIRAVRIDIPFEVLIIYLSVPMVVITLLLVRRNIFFGR